LDSGGDVQVWNDEGNMVVTLLLGIQKNSGVYGRILEEFGRYFENDRSFHGIELEGDKI
jgi:hypothetical protein